LFKTALLGALIDFLLFTTAKQVLTFPFHTEPHEAAGTTGFHYPPVSVGVKVDDPQHL
jgi:hypothetical protein